jgi:mRNA-degrading endonuclease RelE of RelBE toxin-antitoxin system
LSGSPVQIEVQLTELAEQDRDSLRKTYHHINDDLRDFYDSLQRNPAQGAPFGPNGKYHKARMGSRDICKGKSGGFRLFTEVVGNKVVIYSITPKVEDDRLDGVGRLRQLLARVKAHMASQQAKQTGPKSSATPK